MTLQTCDYYPHFLLDKIKYTIFRSNYQSSILTSNDHACKNKKNDVYEIASVNPCFGLSI